jgi:hypothetical protein
MRLVCASSRVSNNMPTVIRTPPAIGKTR